MATLTNDMWSICDYIEDDRFHDRSDARSHEPCKTTRAFKPITSYHIKPIHLVKLVMF